MRRRPPHQRAAGVDSHRGDLRDPSFVVALVIAVVVALGFGLVVPVLPLFARSFGVSVFAASAVVSAFAGARLVSNVPAGVLADRIGTANAVGIGALVVAASSLGAGLAPSYWALLVLRGLGGFGSALFFTALLSLVVRIVPPSARGRAVGSLHGAFLFGIAFGPSVGGVLAEPLGLRWPFVIYAATCALAGVVALVALPRAAARAQAALPADDVETEESKPVVAATDDAHVSSPPRKREGTWRAARRFASDPAFGAALLMMAATRWAATGVRFSLLPLYATERVGLSRAAVGLALTVPAIAHLIVLWPAGRIADTAGRRPLAIAGFTSFAVVASVVGATNSAASFFTVLALYGLATGLTSVPPAAIVADVVPKESTGVGVGVLNTAGDVGSVLGPLVSGLLVDQFGYPAGFAASAALLGAAAVAAWLSRETLPPRDPAGDQAEGRTPVPA